VDPQQDTESASKRFADLLERHGDHPPLDEAVALLAADEDPSVRPESIVQSLDQIATGLHLPEGVATIEAVARVNTHLFATLGFEGDSEAYHDPTNSLMHRVLERRRGLPILLSVLYIEIARRVGLAVDGIGYPGHFIVRPRDADPIFYLDPFNHGKVRRAEALAARLERLIPEVVHDEALRAQFMDPVDARYILSRMTNNLRASYLRSGDGEGVLRSVERLIVLQPHEPSHQRDRGLVLLGLGRAGEGSRQLEEYLRDNPDAPEADVLREHATQATEEGD
jgi:regulator of sirC expression with transglutaminase-like and TPR domain